MTPTLGKGAKRGPNDLSAKNRGTVHSQLGEPKHHVCLASRMTQQTQHMNIINVKRTGYEMSFFFTKYFLDKN